MLIQLDNILSIIIEQSVAKEALAATRDLAKLYEITTGNLNKIKNRIIIIDNRPPKTYRYLNLRVVKYF